MYFSVYNDSQVYLLAFCFLEQDCFLAAVLQIVYDLWTSTICM